MAMSPRYLFWKSAEPELAPTDTYHQGESVWVSDSAPTVPRSSKWRWLDRSQFKVVPGLRPT